MKIPKAMVWLFGLVLVCNILLSLVGCGDKEVKTNSKNSVRVGFFPNITHAQALIGLEEGTFKKHLGNDVEIKTFVFKAGPTAVEAMLAGELDLAYIGPVPAMNGAWRSGGAMKIVAGSAEGGAVLVVRKGAGIASLKDLKGKKIAVPQLANTQDLTLRRLLAQNGLKSIDKGGDVTVLPVENPDILVLFKRGSLDAALVPEPWGSRLVEEAQGQILLNWNEVWEDGKYPVAVLVASTNFMENHPDLLEKWLKGHLDATEKLKNAKEESQVLINKQLKAMTGHPLSQGVLEQSLGRVQFTLDLEKASLQEFLKAAKLCGYSKEIPSLDNLLDFSYLNKVLTKTGS